MCVQHLQPDMFVDIKLQISQKCSFGACPGYNCVYKRRTGNKTDGCATCYRSSRFSEVSVTPIEFFRPQTELLDRHNVGIVMVLQPVVSEGSKDRVKGSLLCVANTHLLFNPRRGDIKLAQLAIMLAEINSVVNSWKAKGEHCNVILCGDFNSVPHMPLYQFITTGELDFQGVPAWMVRLNYGITLCTLNEQAIRYIASLGLNAEPQDCEADVLNTRLPCCHVFQ